MCGIIGYIGDQQAADIVLASLQRLEYRGYDSAGIATVADGQLNLVRSVGKLNNLASLLADQKQPGQIGIGHTRWATHGGVTEQNAHPHTAGGRVAIVHNGIIENYASLKDQLIAEGHIFTSDTDSEVLAHLFLQADKQNLSPEEAMKSVLGQISGAFALAVLYADEEERLLVARQASPLAIGTADGMVCVASDALAMAHLTRNVIYLKDGDFACLTREDVTIWDKDGQRVNREVITVSSAPSLIDKAGYRHFMEKEIHEQPDAIAHTLSAMRETPQLDEALGQISHLVILAAGTSHYAGQVGRYWFEQLAGLPVTVEVASEYRYRHPAHVPDGAALAISQSGESLDTLMAMRHAADLGLKTICIVNVPESTIAREADVVLPTRAGPEIGVASTKAFTAQLTVLLSLAIQIGLRRGHITPAQAEIYDTQLLGLPGAVGQAVGQFDSLRPIAQHLKRAKTCLFLGRGPLFPLALEAALKLKELSYIHAEGFAAGEMKHGPIALIEEGLPVICLLDHHELSAKTVSNLKEAEARGADIILIATRTAAEKVDFAHHKIIIEDCDLLLSPAVLAIPAQILAYLTAVEKGTDVDQPRNLAKSVTVE